LVEQVREVILTDFARTMESSESVIGKFILIAVGIEFLGACLDRQHPNATARSEKRFNLAILKLFPKNYHHFVKQESIPYLFTDFRCPVIHQFRAENSIFLSSINERKFDRHLTYNSDGSLILLAEEFYKDLASAGSELILRLESPGIG
jgi:hypothetical protein